VNSQCMPDMFGNSCTISQDSRRPSVITSRSKGMTSPPPKGTSSPFNAPAMLGPETVVATDDTDDNPTLRTPLVIYQTLQLIAKERSAVSAESATSPGPKGAWAGNESSRRGLLAKSVGWIWREIAALLMIWIHEVAGRHVGRPEGHARRRRRIEIRLVWPIEEPGSGPRAVRLAEPILIVLSMAGRN